MEKLIEQYNQYILNLKPSKTWKVTRFILHWLTLPLKLITIGGLGTFQILSNLKNYRKNDMPIPGANRKKEFFRHVFNQLPVFEGLYMNRVPLHIGAPDGTNQNTDHQCSRQGTYTFVMRKLGLLEDKSERALAKHIQGAMLYRGYKRHFLDGDIIVNDINVSGDMLCGLSLGMVDSKYDELNRKHVNLMECVINNDYALLEGRADKKSDRGMWQPGLETVGAQALTLLASLRLAEKNGSVKCGKEYKKMLYMYGYGLLSLFPTAYIDKQRGYFNDHNCLMALYVLSKHSSSVFGRIFWGIPMVYTWLLSRHWYNGYFTGLLRDCYPNLVSEKYIEKCQAYLYAELPRTWTAEGVDTSNGDIQPSYNEQYEDEFFPDVKQTLKFGQFDPKLKCWGGLGFVATAVMLEKNPKELL